MIIVVLIPLLHLWRDYSGWKNAVGDRSAREAYVTFMEVDVSLIVLTIFVAVVGAWWLKFLARGGE